MVGQELEKPSMGEGERVSVYARSSAEFRTECPLCGAEAVVRESVYELPSVGEAVLVSFTCTKCGYRRSDVVPCRVRRHVRIYYAVESPENLYARVVRSSVATIEIPELGVSVTPGAAATMLVTNVEGILRMIQDAARSIQVLEGGAEGFVRRLEEIIEKGGRFTLIIDDPWGLSSIEPPEGACTAKMLVEEVEGGGTVSTNLEMVKTPDAPRGYQPPDTEAGERDRALH